jgi:hypothetical protein
MAPKRPADDSQQPRTPRLTRFQQRPFIFQLAGKELYKTYSSFLAIDGAAAGSGGARFLPYSHGRHDAEKHKLGVSNQWDLVGIAALFRDAAPSKPSRSRTSSRPVMACGTAPTVTLPSLPAWHRSSVPGRGAFKTQPVTHFFATGDGLWDSPDRNDAVAASLASQLCATAAEQLQRCFADASSAAGGAGPSSGVHCYMCMSSKTAVGGTGQPYWYWWPPKG